MTKFVTQYQASSSILILHPISLTVLLVLLALQIHYLTPIPSSALLLVRKPSMDPAFQLPDSMLAVLSCGSQSGAPIYPRQTLPCLPVQAIPTPSPAREGVNESTCWKRSSTYVLNTTLLRTSFPSPANSYPHHYAQIYLIPKQHQITNAWKVLLNFTQVLHTETSSVQPNSIFFLENLGNNKCF